jgi:hypothetical protein
MKERTHLLFTVLILFLAASAGFWVGRLTNSPAKNDPSKSESTLVLHNQAVAPGI